MNRRVERDLEEMLSIGSKVLNEFLKMDLAYLPIWQDQGDQEYLMTCEVGMGGGRVNAIHPGVRCVLLPCKTLNIAWLGGCHGYYIYSSM